VKRDTRTLGVWVRSWRSRSSRRERRRPRAAWSGATARSQDRLIKKMRLRDISEDAAANAYVEALYLPASSGRYAVAPASPVDYHLPRSLDVRHEDVFCFEHTRRVGNDFVVQFGRRGLQLDRAARGRVPIGSKVIVRESRDGQLRVIHVSRLQGERECRWILAAPRAQKRELALQAPESKPTRTPHRPAPDHPWRRRIVAEPAVRAGEKHPGPSFPHAAAGS
jgi:hypothetical protein